MSKRSPFFCYGIWPLNAAVGLFWIIIIALGVCVYLKAFMAYKHGTLWIEQVSGLLSFVAQTYLYLRLGLRLLGWTWEKIIGATDRSIEEIPKGVSIADDE
jgi:hypothetical protein